MSHVRLYIQNSDELLLTHYLLNNGWPLDQLDNVINSKYADNDSAFVTCPTYDQVFKFFIDEYALHCEFQFQDMTWLANIGMFTVPDFAPDYFVDIKVDTSKMCH